MTHPISWFGAALGIIALVIILALGARQLLSQRRRYLAEIEEDKKMMEHGA
jgi:membrane protein YdbS with pleckstrin-like domain